jgi:dolichol-phosphate mannosyltransferase
VRDFDGDKIPPRSAFGNKLTRSIMRLAFGIKVSDTQTGLRAISNSFARELLDIQGERYEFETNMLLHASKIRVPIIEVPISTIYIDNNSSSHFRTFQDSMRIMGLLLKFASASLCSAVIDYLLFGLINLILGNLRAELRLFCAVAGARIISALFNFIMNRKYVFKSRMEASVSVVRYAALAVFLLLCSYGGIYVLSELLPLPSLVAKLITDVSLFFISFRMQRRWVF